LTVPFFQSSLFSGYISAGIEQVSVMERLTKSVSRSLSGLRLAGWRLELETPGVAATVPMLRGVWGLALRDIDGDAYRRVFEGRGARNDLVPLYVMRPVPARPGQSGAALEFLLFGSACDDAKALMRAWDRASGLGLGPKRAPFRIARAVPLGPEGDLAEHTRWSLSAVPWITAGTGPQDPCRLLFPDPLRMLSGKRLVILPDLPSLVRAALRRLSSLYGTEARRAWELEPAILEEAVRRPATPWKGRQMALVRYSGSQERELELRGVIGSLTLPEGLGPLWPLLAAATWTHLGKGTVFGLGRMILQPAD
jgi:hypothetical protein